MKSILQSFGKLSNDAQYNKLKPNTLQWLNDFRFHCDKVLKLYETPNNDFGIINAAKGFKTVGKDAAPETSQSPIAPKAVETGKK